MLRIEDIRDLRSAPRIRTLVIWLPFLAAWLWSAAYNPFTHVPAYGDTLEVVWGANWYAQHLRQLSNPLFFSGLFHPTGWPTALLAHTPILLLAMGLFRLFLSEAATYNLYLFASFVVAYAGALKAAHVYTSRIGIIVLVALLYTYWGMRWVRLGGHLNILWLSALLPWLFWTLQAEDRRRRIFGAALIWTLCLIASLYGIWLGALVVGIYFLNKPSLDRLGEVSTVALLVLLLSLPTLISFWQAWQLSDAPFYTLHHIAGWGASLNSLPVPAVYHPWLGAFVQTIYRGPLDESSVANMGTVAFVAGISMLFLRRLHEEKERYALLLFVAGLIIALGPVLRWNGRIVTAPLFAPVNHALWDLGHLLNPATFPGTIPQELANGVPLPSWLMYATLPFLEGNRVVARFAFVGGLGLVLLLASFLDRVKETWLLVALALLLIFERVPWPANDSVPLPGNAHPVFEWLTRQQGAVIDLVPDGDQLTLAISGETLYATSLHQMPTASGVSSLWPRSTWILFGWLQRHPRPLQDEEFPDILRDYEVNWILVHLQTGESRRHLEGQTSSGLEPPICFDPPEPPSPWPYPICAFQVTESIKAGNNAP